MAKSKKKDDLEEMNIPTAVYEPICEFESDDQLMETAKWWIDRLSLNH